MKMYVSIDVWKRLEAGEIGARSPRLIRYRCFKVLPDEHYCVQSSDFFDSDDAEGFARSDREFLDLLSFQAPDERAGAYPTLEEAVRARDAEFE